MNQQPSPSKPSGQAVPQQYQQQPLQHGQLQQHPAAPPYTQYGHPVAPVPQVQPAQPLYDQYGRLVQPLYDQYGRIVQYQQHPPPAPLQQQQQQQQHAPIQGRSPVVPAAMGLLGGALLARSIGGSRRRTRHIVHHRR